MEKYNKFMLDLPVELIPETPETGAEFKLSITDGIIYNISLAIGRRAYYLYEKNKGIFKKSGSFYLKEDQVEDSDFVRI